MSETSIAASRRLATAFAWAVLVASVVATGWSWWSGGVVYDLVRGDLAS